jgi:hypothetical protein
LIENVLLGEGGDFRVKRDHFQAMPEEEEEEEALNGRVS